MPQETSIPCSLLEWDSAFFGFRVAQVLVETLSETTGRAVLEWSEAQALRCLYFLADSSSTETADTAHQLGFKMVDVRLQLSLDYCLRGVTPAPKFELGRARSSDIPALQAIAREAHQDSRFFFDRRFSKTRAEDLFARWIAVDCAGRAGTVLTVQGDGKGPVGYITCNVIEGSKTGQIGLVGIASESRGEGLGTSLLSGALEWFASAGAERVLVVTQARNLPAQRLYQKAGFRTDNVKVWYHRWF